MTLGINPDWLEEGEDYEYYEEEQAKVTLDLTPSSQPP